MLIGSLLRQEAGRKDAGNTLVSIITISIQFIRKKLKQINTYDFTAPKNLHHPSSITHHPSPNNAIKAIPA
jgi:hypothetical protein